MKLGKEYTTVPTHKHQLAISQSASTHPAKPTGLHTILKLVSNQRIASLATTYPRANVSARGRRDGPIALRWTRELELGRSGTSLRIRAGRASRAGVAAAFRDCPCGNRSPSRNKSSETECFEMPVLTMLTARHGFRDLHKVDQPVTG